jgi:hypothetical protein
MVSVPIATSTIESRICENTTAESKTNVPVVVIGPPLKPYPVATLVTVPFPLASILEDNEAVSVVFNLLANLDVRFK